MKAVLKNPDILKDKPNLKLKPNHYNYFTKKRHWWSDQWGTAISDGKGGYRRAK